jgi:hypothetical protein
MPEQLHPLFMYGSNLDPQRLRDRAPDWNGHYQLANLQGHELRFHKRSERYGAAANVVPHSTRQVWGIVVELTAADLAQMDRFESCHEPPKQYDRCSIDVQLVDSPNGRQCSVEAYIARPDWILEGLRPTREYLQYVLAGAHHYGFPADYIEAIARLGFA